MKDYSILLMLSRIIFLVKVILGIQKGIKVFIRIAINALYIMKINGQKKKIHAI